MIPTPDPFPDAWTPGLDALRALPDGATALLVGATDRGKTTFAGLAAQALAREIGRIAVVDADIGQSEIGPPGTVGVASATANASKLHDLKPKAGWFVGAFAPVSVALEHAVATGQAAAWAKAQGARRVLVDTTGFVAGPAARRLKVAKASLVQPALIVALAKDGELDGLVSVLGAATGAQTLILPVPDAVGRKSTAFRATRRLTRLSTALDGSREIRLPLDAVATVGATLGSGAPLPPHLVQWVANALRLPVVRGERAENTLALFVDAPPRAGWESIVAPVAEHFGVRTVRVLSLRVHVDLLLGLSDETGRLISVARFLGIDTEHAELRVAAPPAASPDRVRLVSFGRVRVADDGSAGSEVRPGEI